MDREWVEQLPTGEVALDAEPDDVKLTIARRHPGNAQARGRDAVLAITESIRLAGPSRGAHGGGERGGAGVGAGSADCEAGGAPDLTCIEPSFAAPDGALHRFL